MSRKLSVDTVDALTTLGALQLVPENANRWARLAVATGLLSRQVKKTSNRLKRSEIVGLVNSLAGGHSHMEDPAESLFTQGVYGRGGTHVVVTGPVQSSVDELQLLLQASSPIIGLPSRLLGPIEVLTHVALLISDSMCERAGLSRNVESSRTENEGFRVPQQEVLKRLKDAVILEPWAKAMVEQLFARWPEIKDTLVCELPCTTNGYSEALDRANATPIYKVGNEYIVASPSGLVSAPVLATRRLALRLNESKGLAAAIHATALNETKKWLDIWGWKLLASKTDLGASRTSLHYLYDVGKIAHVVVLSDPIATESGPWSAQMAREALTDLAANFPDGVTTLEILASQSFGVPAMMSIASDELDKHSVTMGCGELKAIFLNEPSNPLALEQFARHLRALVSKCRISPSASLELYAMYLSKDHCFYLSDERMPTSLTVMPGHSTAFLSKQIASRDEHGVLDRSRKYVVPVFRDERRAGEPIYHGWREPEIVVEAFSVPIWLVFGAESGKREFLQAGNVVAEAIGYWLFRLEPFLKYIIDPFVALHKNLVITVSIEDDGGWGVVPPTLAEDEVKGFRIVVDEEQGAMQLLLNSSEWNRFAVADNAGERELMKSVVLGLVGLIPVEHRSKFDEGHVTLGVDRFMPLGGEKMILTVVGPEHFELTEARDRPRRRFVQTAETQLILDEVGEVACGFIGPRPRELGIPESVNLINAVVDTLYQRLLGEVKLLSQAAVQQLVAYHDALLASRARQRLMTVPRLTLGGSVDREELEKEDRQYSSSDLALRFVIEIAGSLPSYGSEALSKSSYDRKLGLAYEIIRYGFESDLLQYGLSDSNFAILETGRVGQSREELTKHEEDFFSNFFAGQLRIAYGQYDSYWDRRNGPSEGLPDLAEIDEALTAAFGFSISNLRDGLGLLAFTAFDGGVATITVSRTEIAERLESELGWDPDLADRFLTRLTMPIRKDYLHPPMPYRTLDTWPWRFNRKVSYLRCPILDNRDGTLTWGAHNTWRTGMYWMNLILGGRLAPDTNENGELLTRLQSRLNNRRGGAFEKQVRKRLESEKSLQGIYQVKRIGADGVGSVGEIDGIVLNAAASTIFVTECKSLSMAKTPYEMAQQLASLQDDDPEQRTAVRQAIVKAEWVASRLPQLLEKFPWIEASKDWKVVPLVVLDDDSMILRTNDFDVMVLSFNQLLPHLLRRANPH